MDRIKIPFSEFTFSFSRSGGAGGQNVNKVNSKVTLSWDPTHTSACDQEVVERFRQRFRSYLTDSGLVQITCQEHRSQKANLDACIDRLHEMLNLVRTPPKPRKKTKPRRSAVLKRLDTKKRDSQKKQLRRKDF